MIDLPASPRVPRLPPAQLRSISMRILRKIEPRRRLNITRHRLTSSSHATGVASAAILSASGFSKFAHKGHLLDADIPAPERQWCLFFLACWWTIAPIPNFSSLSSCACSWCISSASPWDVDSRSPSSWRWDSWRAVRSCTACNFCGNKLIGMRVQRDVRLTAQTLASSARCSGCVRTGWWISHTHAFLPVTSQRDTSKRCVCRRPICSKRVKIVFNILHYPSRSDLWYQEYRV